MSQTGARQASEENVPDTNTPGKGKRKSEDGAGGHGRAKRNRYISIACNECKRRKIKCNGENPCQRCGNLSLECIYAPNCCSNGFKESDEFRQMSSQLQSLQEQVNNLYSTVQNLQNKENPSPATVDLIPQSSVGPLDPQITFQSQQSPPHESSQPQSRAFSGPTSSAYFLNYANSSLQTLGLPDSQYEPENGSAGGKAPAKTPPVQVSAVPEQPVSVAKDPLWSLTQDEALRLCHVYADEMGLMYPILDMQKMMNKVKTLFRFLDSIRRVGLMQKESERGDSFNDEDTVTLKLILAAAATVEGNGHSDLGDRLFENVRRIMNIEDKLGKPATFRGLRILVVLAEYYFHKDEEVQAYRIIGIAARQCYELGLHRSDVLASIFTNEEDYTWAVRLFWVIYVLDRRWSFGTGLPFAMQDADIDPTLPEPDDQVPYLRAMVHYGRIASKVWTSVAGFDYSGLDVKKDQIGYLDYQIQQWQSSLPDELKYSSTDNSIGIEELSRGQRRLRLMLYLRANQLRIQLYRPVLYTISSIMENRGYTQTVIEIAKDNIRTLMDVNQTTDIYRSQQVAFHYFLVAALAVLFLAVSHAPSEFSRQVREEYYMALNLIKGFSCKSYISKRLWKTIKGLKKVAPRLSYVGHANTPHSNAAVAMAGLAGHQVDENAVYPGTVSLASSPVNGQQLSQELTQLFETAGGYGEFIGTRSEDMMLNGSDGVGNGFESFSSMWGNDEEFVRIMKECF